MKDKELRAGLGRIIVEEFKDEKAETTIEVPDHMKTRWYKVVEVGDPRTTLEIRPNVDTGDLVQTIPNAGFVLKVDGREYKIINYDDVLVMFI